MMEAIIQGNSSDKRGQVVARIDESLSISIGAVNGNVWFSKDTAIKQQLVHPDICIDDYTDVINHFDDCEVVKEGRNGYVRALLFLIKRGGRYSWRWWKAAIKATVDGQELYLVTVHQLEAKEVDTIREFGIVLREARGKQRITPFFASQYNA